jgi:hypothetical protein
MRQPHSRSLVVAAPSSKCRVFDDRESKDADLKLERRQPKLRLRFGSPGFSCFYTQKLITKVDLKSSRPDRNLSSEGIVGVHWQRS